MYFVFYSFFYLISLLPWRVLYFISDGIAFIVPHQKVSKAEIPSFIVSIDQVEDRSGLDFISVLPDDVEDDIEDDTEAMW